MSEPVAIDPAEGARTWETRWYCEPPTFDCHYRVTSNTWTDDYAVRHIYAWEIDQP